MTPKRSPSELQPSAPRRADATPPRAQAAQSSITPVFDPLFGDTSFSIFDGHSTVGGAVAPAVTAGANGSRFENAIAAAQSELAEELSDLEEFYRLRRDAEALEDMGEGGFDSTAIELEVELNESDLVDQHGAQQRAARITNISPFCFVLFGRISAE